MVSLPRTAVFILLFVSYFLFILLAEFGNHTFNIGFVILPFLIGIISYFFTPLDIAKPNMPPVGMSRRYFAASADIIVLIFILFPILALVDIFIQSIITKTLVIEYGFYNTGNDWEVIPLFAGLIYYFYFHFKNEKQTAGQKLLGFEVFHLNNVQAKPAKRLIYGTLAMGFAPISLLSNMHVKDGIYYWDYESGMRARRVT